MSSTPLLLADVAPGSAARAQAERLLADVGMSRGIEDAELDHPAISWARAGLQQITGARGAPGLMAPVGLTAAADGALEALRALSPAKGLEGLRGSVLLGERSRLAGLERSGPVAPGQGCRLLPTLDGVLAVSLVRPSDWDFAPAWLECAAPEGWAELARVLKRRTTGACLERGRLLGLAVADAAGERGGGPWFETIFRTAGAAAPRRRPPLVVDFSALWAGPLCGDLLGRLGARVIKVESVGRSDGARLGEPAFFARLNGGKASVALDFRAPQDRAALLGLIQAADIVLESSRPRALRQLGIYAEELIERTPGMTWIAISGHGRREPQGDWTGFGDDAGVAAGLSRLMKDVHGDWLFCGDAIADPLTGLHAALLAWSSWLQGGGVLQSVSLSSVVASVIAADRLPDAGAYRQRTAAWSRLAQAAGGPLYDLPVARAPVEAMGASNHLIPPC